jgi:hypothetical protein
MRRSGMCVPPSGTRYQTSFMMLLSFIKESLSKEMMQAPSLMSNIEIDKGVGLENLESQG